MFLVFAPCSMHSYGQRVPVYPIPSFQVPVEGNAIFRENGNPANPIPTEEKREIKVHVTTSDGSQNCQATVWVYSLDHTSILGPYIVDCGETLTVEVDDRSWGVLVESENETIADVWTSP